MPAPMPFIRVPLSDKATLAKADLNTSYRRLRNENNQSRNVSATLRTIDVTTGK